MTSRSLAADVFCASIEKFKDIVAGGFGECFSAQLQAGEKMPDHALALALISRRVQSTIKALTDAEEEYTSQGFWRNRARKECERIARKELNPRMVVVRRGIDSIYGKEEGALIHGLEGKTLRKPSRVVEQCRGMVGALKGLQLELPNAKMDGITPDRDAWLRQVEPAYDRLVAKMNEVERRKQGEEYARGARDLALEEFDELYGEALAYTQGAYRLVGVAERVVQKLRPGVERRRLIREARLERKARAEGRRAPVLRSAVSTAARWLKRLRSQIA